jgi:sugar diacid utilization regulator
MDWQLLKEKLQDLLDVTVDVVKLPLSLFDSLSNPYSTLWHTTQLSITKEGWIYYFLENIGQDAIAIQIDSGKLSAKEKRLIAHIIISYRDSQVGNHLLADYNLQNKKQTNQQQVVVWIKERLEHRDLHAVWPDHLLTDENLFSPHIPILLYGDFIHHQGATDEELKKLLQSFFDVPILFLTIKPREWLLFVPDQILEDEQEQVATEEDGEFDTTEYKLEAIAEGLHEMLANEWIGECQLAIHYPVIPAQEIIFTFHHLREMTIIGKTFHNHFHIYPTWKLYLEKLMYTIADKEKALFIDEIMKDHGREWDEEIIQTIDYFVSSNCNVSQTAKKLYIHRNTLLYRLDKFKQITGRDVRNFEDAILVKLALLLYKMTKK